MRFKTMFECCDDLRRCNVLNFISQVLFYYSENCFKMFMKILRVILE